MPMLDGACRSSAIYLQSYAPIAASRRAAADAADTRQVSARREGRLLFDAGPVRRYSVASEAFWTVSPAHARFQFLVALPTGGGSAGVTFLPRTTLTPKRISCWWSVTPFDQTNNETKAERSA